MIVQRTKTVATIVLLCALPLAYLFAVACYQSRFVPATDVGSYSELKAQGVPLESAVRVANPKKHVCVFGDTSSGFWTLRSGPPAYLFNEAGSLVDYTLDVGDNTDFQYTYDVYSGVEIDMNSLEDQFGGTP